MKIAINCFFMFMLHMLYASSINDTLQTPESIDNKIYINEKEEVISIPLNDSVIESLQLEQPNLRSIVNDTVPPTTKMQNSDYIYNPPRDPKRLLLNTSLYVGTAVSAFAILWFAPESFSQWDKDDIKERGFFAKWKDNIKQKPTWDNDDFVLNYITHPYSGGVYYMSARGSGYKPWESLVYASLMSTFFWEYGVEAFAERPSLQDLFVTPLMGAAVGEGFFHAKRSIIQKNRKVLKSRFLGETTLFLIDPFNQILDWTGYKSNKKHQAQAMLMPIDYDIQSNKTVWGLNARFTF